MEQNKRNIGANYERIAGNYLEHLGYEILEYNFYCRTGELDIVARNGNYLVFVEVKFRKNMAKGHPFEAVSLQKQKAISKCALFYMKKRGLLDMPVRFDVVGILGDEIQVIQNAFEFVR